MALRLTSKGNVRFSWADGEGMEALWAISPDDSEAELLSKMKRIVAFVEAQSDKPPLPERIPGVALGMAQTAHPAPAGVQPATGNGWAAIAPPALPEDRKGEWELMPPEEQG
jgi:hypothetical protein